MYAADSVCTCRRDRPDDPRFDRSFVDGAIVVTYATGDTRGVCTECRRHVHAMKPQPFCTNDALLGLDVPDDDGGRLVRDMTEAPMSPASDPDPFGPDADPDPLRDAVESTRSMDAAALDELRQVIDEFAEIADTTDMREIGRAIEEFGGLDAAIESVRSEDR